MMSTQVLNESFCEDSDVFHTTETSACACTQWAKFELKHEQLLAAAHVLSRRDMFVVLSTGFGKSIMYQVLDPSSQSVSQSVSLSLSLSLSQFLSLSLS